MEKEVYKSTETKMEETIRVLKRELNTIRTGRASLSLLDGVKVDYFGTPTPLNQVASLSSPDSRSLLIQPWDKTLLPEIEKAILKANIGLTPNNDGKLIRISIPPLTEERRKELVKVARKIAEDSRISSRNVRREANEELKKLEKAKSISEDDLHRAQDNIQEITDKHIEGINDILTTKEKEIMEI